MLRFDPEALQLLMDHTWPGNVRELENVVERAVVLAATQVIPLDVLPDYLLHAGGIRIRRSENGALPADASLFEIVADFERRTIIEHLERFNWSQTDAAEGSARAAFHAESEDQALEYRRQAQGREDPVTSREAWKWLCGNQVVIGTVNCEQLIFVTVPLTSRLGTR